MARPRHWSVAAAAAALVIPAIFVAAPRASAHADPAATLGAWTAPFEEQGSKCVTDADGRELCKPAGATIADLTTGRILYFNEPATTENVNLSAVFELGQDARNDRTREIDLSGA